MIEQQYHEREVHDETMRIKELRKSRRLSQTKLAQLSGIGIATIASLESGGRMPNATTLMSIADVLHCSIDALLGRSTSFEDGYRQGVLDAEVAMQIVAKDLIDLKFRVLEVHDQSQEVLGEDRE